MELSNELVLKIDRLLKNNDELKKRIKSGDSGAIQEIGYISQQRIEPKYIVECYENDTIDNLYKKAKQLMELQELYNELCDMYYCQIRKDHKLDER